MKSWTYKSEAPEVRHLGPVAQDFYSTFSLGQDDRHISTIDANGVALAAVQGLHRVVQKRDARLATLTEHIETLAKELDDQKALYRALAVRFSALEKGILASRESAELSAASEVISER